jgi:hypothetical protein
MVKKPEEPGGYVGKVLAKRRRSPPVDPAIAALSGLVSDLVTVVHELARDRMDEILRHRRLQLQTLEHRRRTARFDRELLVQQLAVELMHHAMGRG